MTRKGSEQLRTAIAGSACTTCAPSAGRRRGRGRGRAVHRPAGDLSADLGHPGDAGHPEVQAAIEDAIRRIRACGSVAGFLTGDEGLARRYIELGCLVAAVGADVGIPARGSEQLAAKLKNSGIGMNRGLAA